MTSQQQKPGCLPNPYSLGGLPNPYALTAAADTAPSKLLEEQAKAEEKKITVKLFHNPHMIRRPQAKTANPGKKPTAPKPVVAAMPSTSSDGPGPQFVQPSIDYFRSTVDDDNAINEARREAEKEKRAAWKNERKFKQKYGNWNPTDPYKLRAPTNISAYKASGQHSAKQDEFRNYLRELRQASAPRDSSSHASDPYVPQSASHSPMSSMNRSPDPRSDEMDVTPPRAQMDNPEIGDGAYESGARLLEQQTNENVVSDKSSTLEVPFPLPAQPGESSVLPPLPVVDNAKTGDEAFQRRLRLAQQLAAKVPSRPPPPPQQVLQNQAPPPPPPAVPYSATISAAPVHYNHTISAAPVHYARPDVEMTDAPGPASDRPSKKQKTEAPKLSKAAKMMAKMGYVKGQGLGKNNDGVTSHLEVKRRADHAGKGGRQFRDEVEAENDYGVKAPKPQQIFDITGGQLAKPKEKGKWGEPSRVVIAWGCVDGVDFGSDADREDGGIRQEIGDAFNARFGPVERIHVNLQSESRPVYIQFRDMMCALNAVNRFSEGFEFQGRSIRAHFYDEAKFNNLVYDL